MIDEFELRSVRADLRVAAKKIQGDFGEAAAARLVHEAERLLARLDQDPDLVDPGYWTRVGEYIAALEPLPPESDLSDPNA